MAQCALSYETRELLRTVRDARFASGTACAWCGNTRIQRWGIFSGRQRYRCNDCRRTFSDLTGTLLSNTKRLDRWAAFLANWHAATSVRRTAAAIGVHPATAFRWRHWLCDALGGRDGPRLSGWTEVAELRLRYSEKGKRRTGRHLDGQHSKERVRRQARRRVSVVVLHDRRDGVLTDLAGGRRLELQRLSRLYETYLESDAVLLSAHRRFAPIAAAARVLRIPHLRVPREACPHPIRHLENATTYGYRLMAWLERFRGVATRYLPNYLVWHAHVERLEAERVYQLTVRSCFGRADQQAARTLGEEHAGWAPRSRPSAPAACPFECSSVMEGLTRLLAPCSPVFAPP